MSIIYTKIKSHGDIADSIIWTDTIPKEYSQMLKLQDKCCNISNKNVTLVKTVVSKYRNPVSSFYIDNKYYLQIYRMDNAFKYSLKDAIKDSFSNAYTSIYMRYSLDDRTNMKFLYKLTKPPKPKDIYIDLFGDSTKVLKKNDTIAYYFSKCKNFSVKFNFQDPNDIYGECKNQNPDSVPLEILFLKSHGKLYMLMLSSKRANDDLKPGTLFMLLTNK